jgi:amino acid adenylation domain-containing protein
MVVKASYYTNQDPEIFRKVFEHSISFAFEEIVSKYPKRLAVRSGDGDYTYQQLNRSANRIARLIQECTKKTEQPVPLLLHKNHQLMATMLGILKSGNIYVPLAPSDPPARIARILEDCGTSLVLTDTDHLAQVRSFATPGIRIVNVEDIKDPDALSFIIYTSGSGGKPKGVMQTHRNIRHFINNYAEFISVTPDDRLSLLSPFSHVASVMDIFSAFLYGASLFPFDVYSKGIGAIKDWLIAEQITIYHSVPTLFRAFIDLLDGSEKFPDLRMVDMGGEIVYDTDVDAFRQNFPEWCMFVNGLGSTELPVIFRCFLDKDYENTSRIVPIGYPVYGVEHLLLDEQGIDVGQNAVGEIVYASPALPPGYWNAPELNETLFRSLPGHPGKRWFFSGDLGMRNADGSLTLLGRKDLQIKVRGFKVELIEIEHMLSRHPEIKQAVVVDRANVISGTSLVAFVIPHNIQEFNSSNLREFLSTSLPDYMIPDQFVFLEKFPTTATGKLDRNALKGIEIKDKEHKPKSRDPKPGMETDLVKIWKAVLGLQQISLDENFFEIGGNSLIALRLAYDIHKELGLDLPLTTIFEAPTIEEMAEYLDQASEGKAWKAVHAVKHTGSKIPLFMVSPTVIDVITYHDLADHLDPEQPLYALYSQRWGSFRELDPNENEEISKFVDEIKKIQPTGPYLLGGYSAGGRAALQIAHQLEAGGDKVGCAMIMDAFGPEYPKLLPHISPRMFNRLKIIRRVESYLWKFWILDWAGKRDLILSREKPLTSRVSNWIENRTGEYRKANEKTSRLVQKADDYPFQEIKSPIVLIRAKRGLMGVQQDHSLGWQQVFGDKLSVVDVPGDHEAILFGPRIVHIGKLIQDLLDRAV